MRLSRRQDLDDQPDHGQHEHNDNKETYQSDIHVRNPFLRPRSEPSTRPA